MKLLEKNAIDNEFKKFNKVYYFFASNEKLLRRKDTS
jgi:hypothetical protein